MELLKSVCILSFHLLTAKEIELVYIKYGHLGKLSWYLYETYIPFKALLHYKTYIDSNKLIFALFLSEARAYCTGSSG